MHKASRVIVRRLTARGVNTPFTGTWVGSQHKCNDPVDARELLSRPGTNSQLQNSASPRAPGFSDLPLIISVHPSFSLCSCTALGATSQQAVLKRASVRRLWSCDIVLIGGLAGWCLLRHRSARLLGHHSRCQCHWDISDLNICFHLSSVFL